MDSIHISFTLLYREPARVGVLDREFTASDRLCFVLGSGNDNSKAPDRIQRALGLLVEDASSVARRLTRKHQQFLLRDITLGVRMSVLTSPDQGSPIVFGCRPFDPEAMTWSIPLAIKDMIQVTDVKSWRGLCQNVVTSAVNSCVVADSVLVAGDISNWGLQ